MIGNYTRGGCVEVWSLLKQGSVLSTVKLIIREIEKTPRKLIK